LFTHSDPVVFQQSSTKTIFRYLFIYVFIYLFISCFFCGLFIYLFLCKIIGHVCAVNKRDKKASVVAALGTKLKITADFEA
jgi:hypothetical protein